MAIIKSLYVEKGLWCNDGRLYSYILILNIEPSTLSNGVWRLDPCKARLGFDHRRALPWERVTGSQGSIRQPPLD